MATPRLIDETPTRQDQQIADLGGDLYLDHQDDDEEPSYGSDPFDIISHREELGQSLDD